MYEENITCNIAETKYHHALQCRKMSGSATPRKFLTKYLSRKFSYILQETFVILYTRMPYSLVIKNP
jgi:hypothetical protein